MSDLHVRLDAAVTEHARHPAPGPLAGSGVTREEIDTALIACFDLPEMRHLKPADHKIHNLTDAILELIQSKAQPPRSEQGDEGWRCPRCGVVPGREVTFQEYHQECGAKVSASPPKPEPSPRPAPGVLTEEPTQPFLQHYDLAKRIAKLAAMMRGVSLLDWDGFLNELNTVLANEKTRADAAEQKLDRLTADQRQAWGSIEAAYIIACRSYPYYHENRSAFDKDLGDQDTQAYRAHEVAQRLAAHFQPPSAQGWRTDDLARLKYKIDMRLNDRLCEMKPNYDDSIVGFNEAWTIVSKAFAEGTPPSASPPPAEKGADA